MSARAQCLPSPTVSAALAPRWPIGRAVPTVVSTRVCFSTSALISAICRHAAAAFGPDERRLGHAVPHAAIVHGQVAGLGFDAYFVGVVENVLVVFLAKKHLVQALAVGAGYHA